MRPRPLACARRDRSRADAVGGQLLVLAATAVLAAAIGNPIVEGISRTGLVGGSYDDTNRLSVVPALFAGLVLALGALGLRCLRAWRGSTSAIDDDWLHVAARAWSRRSLRFDLLAVFAMQMIALFAMETSERLLTDGHLVSGLAWLGGPVWFSILVHATLSFACLTVLCRFMRASVATIVDLLHETMRFFCEDLDDDARFVRRAFPPTCSGTSDPCIRRTRGRAPPTRRAFA